MSRDVPPDDAATTALTVSGQHLQLGDLIAFDPLGITFKREPSFDEWESCGRLLRLMAGALQWWLGDWLNYGERVYGEKYSQAVDETDYSYGRLADFAYVAKAVEPSRRHENLSWSHHREVAKLSPEQQAQLLDRAEREGWGVRQTRNAVHAVVPHRAGPSARTLPFVRTENLPEDFKAAVREGLQGSAPADEEDRVATATDVSEEEAKWLPSPGSTLQLHCGAPVLLRHYFLSRTADLRLSLAATESRNSHPS